MTGLLILTEYQTQIPTKCFCTVCSVLVLYVVSYSTLNSALHNRRRLLNKVDKQNPYHYNHD